MPNSFTNNLNLEKPEVGADSNLWGGHLNSDLDILDSIFTSATTRPQSTIIKSDTKWVDATTTSRAFILKATSISNGATRELTVQDSNGTLAYLTDVNAVASAITSAVAASTVGMVDTSSAQIISNKGFATSTTATASQATTTTTLLASVGYADRVAVQQVVTTITGAVTTGTTTIPLDDSPPQNTEGTEFMTATITPKSATSKLRIDVNVNASQSAGSANNIIAALFQDSTADAIASNFNFSSDSLATTNIQFTWVMTSGTTSATTFKVRVGAQSSIPATVTFNGTAGSRVLGGTIASSIIIEEFGI